jgi:hypothetical protein
MKIHVHIERLVLDGLPMDRRSGLLVQAAIERELGRMFKERAHSENLISGGATPYLRTDDISVPPDGDAAQIGGDVARSIHGGLHR